MAKRPPNGLEFPVDATGRRSTTAINQEAFARSIEPISKEAAEAVRKQRGWRFGYAKHLVKNVELCAADPANPLVVAQAGLDYLHDSFEFIRDGKTTSLNDAMKTFTEGTYKTGVIKGSAPRTTTEYEVPYKTGVLKGDGLRSQIEQWVRAGVIELSCGQALLRVADSPTWLDLSDQYFVLLGASSAMGPLPMLLALGANVIAIDLDRSQIWEKVVNMARNSPGTLIFPLSKDQNDCKDDADLFASAGSNLLSATPEIRNWLMKVVPGKPLVVGAYAYLDGPLFVRVSMAMDAIIKDLTKHRKDTAVAYLCTPTDAHLSTPGAVQAARSNLRRAPFWQKLLGLCLGCTKMRMAPNARRPVQCSDGSSQHVVDAIVPQQGPNYILAKRLQHWRAMLARAGGCIVSTNIAPSTATASVVSNFSFKLAYGGMGYFKPLEVFQEETSNAVMGGLLLHDISNPESASHPDRALRNPLNLFTETSFHGGAWRCGYKFGCIGTGSVVGYLIVHYLVTAYLVAYNLLQSLGWGVALLKAVELLSSPAGVVSPGLWAVAGQGDYGIHALTMFTMLEVVHSALGMVRAPVATTALQVASRVLLVRVVEFVPACHDLNPWLYCMVFAWSLTEVVRYMFYALNLVGVNLYPLKWLRYTMFLVLYPLGVSGEVGCMHAALLAGVLGPAAAATASTPWLLANFAQPVFRALPFWPTMALAWGGGLALLYTMMLGQRARALGSKTKKLSGNKKKQ